MENERWKSYGIVIFLSNSYNNKKVISLRGVYHNTIFQSFNYYILVFLTLNGNIKTLKYKATPAKKDLSKNWDSLIAKASIINPPMILNRIAIKNKLICMDLL